MRVTFARPIVALALVIALGIMATLNPARASWFGSSVSSLDVRGVSLGMTLETVAKLHPELHQQAIGTDGFAGGKDVKYDPSLVQQRLEDGGSCGGECFYVDFASPKGGGVVYNLYLKQSLPSGTNMADLLAEMEKKYGSPTDTQQTNDVADDSGTITATWGMTIADSSLDASPQSGQVLKIELDNVDGEEVTVSFFLKDFTVEAADEQARKAFLAQAAAQQASQANKSLNY